MRVTAAREGASSNASAMLPTMDAYLYYSET